MLRIDRIQKSLKSLEQRAFPDVGIKEREDLQQMIRNSPDTFFREMGESLLLIGEEVRPTDFVEDRIDLLAIDPHGASVVIELKRGTHKLQLLQGISYAAMVSKWEGSRILEERERLTGRSTEEVEGEIESFLLEDLECLNRSQRLILMAEDFDYEVLISAEWLTEMFAVDIRCYRLNLSVEGEVEYLSCTCVYPPPEITKFATRRGRSNIGTLVVWKDWDSALSLISNQAIVEFFKEELRSGVESYLKKRTLHYRVDGRRCLSISARKTSAYVWQYYRFNEDVEFWRESIGSHINVKPVKKTQSGLRFFLSSTEDFARFKGAFSKVASLGVSIGKNEEPEENEDFPEA